MFSTQTRILLTEWKAITKLIVDHSIPAKEKPISHIEELENFDIEHLENLTFSTAEAFPHILSEKQIATALQGPYGAHIRQKMAAYAKNARFRLELHLNKEEMFKNKRLVLPPEEQLSPKKLLKLSFNDLDKIQNELDSLTKEHDAQWRAFLQDWTKHLANFLVTSGGVPLTEREHKELHDEDIATELLPRFIEVGLATPEPSYPQLNFSTYLYLKAMLAVQSALSRQHLPHGESEIDNILKKYKSEWATMENQERDGLEKQKEITQSALQPLD